MPSGMLSLKFFSQVLVCFSWWILCKKLFHWNSTVKAYATQFGTLADSLTPEGNRPHKQKYRNQSETPSSIAAKATNNPDNDLVHKRRKLTHVAHGTASRQPSLMNTWHGWLRESAHFAPKQTTLGITWPHKAALLARLSRYSTQVTALCGQVGRPWSAFGANWADSLSHPFLVFFCEGWRLAVPCATESIFVCATFQCLGWL